MINFILAAMVFVIAIASEILASLENRKTTTVFQWIVPESPLQKRLRFIRPFLIAALVWFLACQVEKRTLENANQSEARKILVR